jgi:hypothetical protein
MCVYYLEHSRKALEYSRNIGRVEPQNGNGIKNGDAYT